MECWSSFQKDSVIKNSALMKNVVIDRRPKGRGHGTFTAVVTSLGWPECLETS